MAPFIEARNLHKTYTTDSQDVEVLRGIDLTIETGEALAISGASGAGKSTLLHLLGALDKPSAGNVFLKGQNLFELDEAALSSYRNLTMGFVFQFHHLLPMLTCLENTSLPGMIAGRPREELESEAARILDQVGLKHRLQHRPAELSGGEQQRVAIARAVLMNPEILFADEPTGNLDSRTGEEVADLLLDLKDRKKMALIVVTHNEALAARFERRLHMRDGRIDPVQP